MEDTSNLIWLALIVFFSLVPVLKAVKSKQKTAQMHHADDGGDTASRAFASKNDDADFFYSKEEESPSDLRAWEQELKQHTVQHEASGAAKSVPLREEGGSAFANRKATLHHADEVLTEDGEEPVLDISDTDEVRKAVIAAEILNKKYE